MIGDATGSSDRWIEGILSVDDEVVECTLKVTQSAGLFSGCVERMNVASVASLGVLG
jgi:hypothetical protein